MTTDYATRRAARIARLQDRAARLRADGEARVTTASNRAAQIPLGQPMMPDHSSYTRDRNNRDRIQAGFRAGFARLDEAADVERRAAAAESNRAISGDDPEAIDRLRAKLDRIERKREAFRQTNATLRDAQAAAKRDGSSPEETTARAVAALAALGMTEATAAKLVEPDDCGRVGVPDYALTNLASEARRLRKRIADLEAKAARPETPPEMIGEVRIEEAENRVRLFFPGKPGEAVRSALKAAGFRWAPSEGAWQRNASVQAWVSARGIAGMAIAAASARLR